MCERVFPNMVTYIYSYHLLYSYTESVHLKEVPISYNYASIVTVYNIPDPGTQASKLESYV